MAWEYLKYKKMQELNNGRTWKCWSCIKLLGVRVLEHHLLITFPQPLTWHAFQKHQPWEKKQKSITVICPRIKPEENKGYDLVMSKEYKSNTGEIFNCAFKSAEILLSFSRVLLKKISEATEALKIQAQKASCTSEGKNSVWISLITYRSF